MLNFKKILTIYLISIVVTNLLMYVVFLKGIKPFSDSEEGMIIIKLKPLKYVMVFAHGIYQYHCYPNDLNCSYQITQHFTTLNSTDSIPTKDLLDQLKEEGFEKVWLSQCDTGDMPWMIYYLNLTKNENGLINSTKLYNATRWYDWVSRNEKPGDTYPIFIGFGFIRISL